MTSPDGGKDLVQRLGDFLWSLVSWVPMTLAIAVSPALLLWPLAHEESRDYLIKNELPIEDRHAIVTAMGGSVLVVLALYLVGWLWMRRKEGGLAVADAFKRINHYAFIALSLPLLAAFSAENYESKHGVMSALILLIAAGMVIVWCYRVSAHRRLWEAIGAKGVRLPRTLTAVMTLGYMAGVGYLALRDHFNLGTHTYDLGIYDNILWQTAHGNFLGCSLIKGGEHTTAHFDPILALLVPVYWIFPRAETLLVIQTVWLATGVIPLYFIARRALGNEWFGCLMAATYFFYPALHGVNMFDFHSLTLVVPFLLWAVHLIDEGPDWRFALLFCLILATREDMSLLSLGLALYAISLRHYRTGAVVAFVGISYLAIVKLFVMADSSLLMPGGKETYSYTYFFEELIPHKEEGAKGLLVSVLTNPVYALDILTKEKKVLYFFYLLAPLLFLPFFSRKKLLLCLYGFAFIGVASRTHVFSLHFQYSAVLFPFLMAATPAGLANVAKLRVLPAAGLEPGRVRWSLAGAMVVVCMLVSWNYGVIFPNDSFKAGWNRMSRVPSEETKERYRRVREMIDMIPAEAAVSSTSEIGPHVSNRAEAYRWPLIRSSDYLILRTKNFKKKDHRKLKRQLDLKAYELIDEHGTIRLYRRLIPRDQKDGRTEEEKAEIRRKREEKRRAKKNKNKKAKAESKKADKQGAPTVEGDPPIRKPRGGNPMDKAKRSGAKTSPSKPATKPAAKPGPSPK